MQTIRAFTNDSFQFIVKFLHVNIHKHWLRQKIQNYSIYIIWINSSIIILDESIKIFFSQHYENFIKLLKVKRNLHLHENDDAFFEKK